MVPGDFFEGNDFMSGPWKQGLRFLAMALCLATCVAMAQPVSALPETPAAQASTQQSQSAAFTYTTVMHWKASYSSLVIGQVKDGEQVIVTGTSGNFYKINSYGLTAYIAKSQIRKGDDGKYYVKCDPQSSQTRTMELVSRTQAQTLRSGLLQTTKKQVGYPYVYGGTRPGGFDCSGLLYYVYGQNGITIHRGGGSQPGDGIPVAKEDLQVGDLVFFRVPGEYSFMSHVGIYVGNNQIIHAGSRGVGYASLSNVWFSGNYLCARRVVLESNFAIDLLPSVNADSVLDYSQNTEGLRTSE